MRLELELEKKLEILEERTLLDVSLNDLRILAGCMSALAYQADVDGEPYLDPDALKLKERLAALYTKLLHEHGKNGGSH
jgi:hypothetical protein